MAPNVTTAPAAVLYEEDLAQTNQAKPKVPTKIVWFNVMVFILLHIGALYGAYLLFTSVKLITIVYSKLLIQSVDFYLCYEQYAVKE